MELVRRHIRERSDLTFADIYFRLLCGQVNSELSVVPNFDVMLRQLDSKYKAVSDD